MAAAADLIPCPHCGKKIDPESNECAFCHTAMPRHVVCAVCHLAVEPRGAKSWKEKYGGAILHGPCFDTLFESVNCPSCNQPYFQPEREPVQSAHHHFCQQCKTELHIATCSGCHLSLVVGSRNVLQASVAGRGTATPPAFHAVCHTRHEAELRRAAQQRQNTIMDHRKTHGQCMMCGEALSILDKLARHTQHKACDTFFP